MERADLNCGGSGRVFEATHIPNKPESARSLDANLLK